MRGRPAHRYVFVCGLHRTGTSLLARLLGQHPDIAGITGAPVPENEGCYLQGAIPHTARHGIPGEYAIDPDQHLTEAHPLNTLETKQRLESEWGEWFDPAKPWRVEKSPVNLTRMRLLQALFPLAQFVIVTRHPDFMAQALSKWTDREAWSIAEYGAKAYKQMLDDLAFLHSALVLRYEDFVLNPIRHTRAMEAFLSLDSRICPQGIRDGNADYTPSAGQHGQVAKLGYDRGGSVSAFEPVIQHPLRSIREQVAAHLLDNACNLAETFTAAKKEQKANIRQ